MGRRFLPRIPRSQIVRPARSAAFSTSSLALELFILPKVECELPLGVMIGANFHDVMDVHGILTVERARHVSR